MSSCHPLSRKSAAHARPGVGRHIRAVNLAVALGAFCCHDLLNIIHFPDPVTGMSRKPGVKVHVMALKTDKGFVLFQQVIGNGSVRIVTDGAILGYRRVLKNKGPFLVSVAGVTEVVDALFRLEHPPVGRRMGIMATGANHLTFPDGMMRGHIGLSPLFLVAAVTQVRLLFC